MPTVLASRSIVRLPWSDRYAFGADEGPVARGDPHFVECILSSFLRRDPRLLAWRRFPSAPGPRSTTNDQVPDQISLPTRRSGHQRDTDRRLRGAQARVMVPPDAMAAHASAAASRAAVQGVGRPARHADHVSLTRCSARASPGLLVAIAAFPAAWRRLRMDRKVAPGGHCPEEAVDETKLTLDDESEHVVGEVARVRP